MGSKALKICFFWVIDDNKNAFILMTEFRNGNFKSLNKTTGIYGIKYEKCE